jgi:hypothetical protein
VEEWRPLQNYPGYSASNLGYVRNDDRDRILSIVKNQNGNSYVGLMQQGLQVKRSLSLLVAQTFLPIPQHPAFNTPIHFDGDLSNCKVDNMDWRPRWFAIKHVRQFRIDIMETPNSVLNLNTEEIFENCWGAVFKYGLLYLDLVISIVHKEAVFPTLHMYDWSHCTK